MTVRLSRRLPPLLALLSAAVVLAAPPAASAWPDEGDQRIRREVVIVGSEEGRPRILESFVRRGFLGVQLIDLTPELRAHWSLPDDRGILVSKVVDGSPADLAGLRVGDFVTAVDGSAVRSSSQLAGRVGRKTQGDRVEIEVVRAGASLSLTAILTEHERPQLELGQFLWRGEGEQPGILHLDPDREVEVITVDPESINDSVRQLMERLQASGLPGRMRIEASERQELERRIEELEQRLRAMERRLQGQAPDGG